MINCDEAIGKKYTGTQSALATNSRLSYRILMVGGSGSRKSNAVLNIINHQPVIDQVYLYAKDPCKRKYQLLFNNIICCFKIFKRNNGFHEIL